ncbi:hypothetical protein Bbelb_298160 [Branchiostoma belcheri]|nr:hypothetical protein Bbelb_298160 [Branchiostoma belcheri]
MSARIRSFVRSPRAVNRSDRTWRTGLHGRAGAGSRPGGGETEIPPATLANTCQKRFVRTLDTLSSRDLRTLVSEMMIAVCNVVKYSRRLNQHGGVITEGCAGSGTLGRRVWRQEANNRSLSTEKRYFYVIKSLSHCSPFFKTDGIRPFLLACEARSYGSCLGCVNTRNFVRVQHQTICGLVNKAASPNTRGACPNDKEKYIP